MLRNVMSAALTHLKIHSTIEGAGRRRGDDAVPMRTATGFRVLVLICLAVSAGVAQTPTARIVTAVNKFMATLDAQQRQRFLFAFDDQQQRVRWSNLPVRMVPRAGLSMGELNA